jgi:cytochrome b561
MKRLHWLTLALTLAVLVTGCAYNDYESGSGEPYRQPAHTGHHH